MWQAQHRQSRGKVSPGLRKRTHAPNSLQLVTHASTAPFTRESISARNRYRLLQAFLSFSPLQADTDNVFTTERWPLISNTSRPYGKRMHSLQLSEICALLHFILLKCSGVFNTLLTCFTEFCTEQYSAMLTRGRNGNSEVWTSKHPPKPQLIIQYAHNHFRKLERGKKGGRRNMNVWVPLLDNILVCWIFFLSSHFYFCIVREL